MSRIIKETTVYGGPRTSGYATMATLHQNQSVTAIFKELDFLFVEYDGVNRTKRRGYVLARMSLQEMCSCRNLFGHTLHWQPIKQSGLW